MSEFGRMCGHGVAIRPGAAAAYNCRSCFPDGVRFFSEPLAPLPDVSPCQWCGSPRNRWRTLPCKGCVRKRNEIGTA